MRKEAMDIIEQAREVIADVYRVGVIDGKNEAAREAKGGVVIRCKRCRYYDDYSKTFGRCTFSMLDDQGSGGRKPDDFCSMAKLKEGESVGK